jgi:hypothetical protein
MVRACAWLVAISLVFGGYVAAGMPLHAPAATMAKAAAEGCDHHEAPMLAKHGHADGCCRAACACAFAHAIGNVPALPSVQGVLAATMPSALLEAGVHGLLSPPPLRPPIA